MVRGYPNAAARLRARTALAVLIVALPGCHRESAATKSEDAAVATAGAARQGSPSDASRPGPRLPAVPAPPEVAAPPASAVRTRTGLASLVIAPGSGTVHPTDFDLVRIRYVAWTKDGKMIGSSDPDPFDALDPEPENPPAETRVNASGSAGSAEGLKLMVTGERRRLWIPALFAPELQPRQDVVMDVELVDIVPTPPIPPVPEDAAGPAARAAETRSGLRWRLVAAGPKGARSPRPQDVVVYNFTTWTRKGETLSSSFPNGRPEVAGVSTLAAPWKEAIQLMKVGDTLRMWFAQNQGAPPGGPYVADVELIYVYPVDGP